MNEVTDKLVQQLASPIIAAQKRSTRFKARNRNAWMRMNRPHKVKATEKGMDKIFKLLAWFKL